MKTSLLNHKHAFFAAVMAVLFLNFSAGAQTIQWQKALGGSSNDYTGASKQTTDKGYITVGFTYSSNGDINTPNHGNADLWVVKLDSTGTIQWQKTLGGSGFDRAYSVQQTTDGGYIIAGYTKSADGDVTGNHGDFDIWIIKLAGDGSLQWQKTLGGTDFEQAFSIQQTLDGGYIVAGKTLSTDGDVTGNHGNFDGWVVKLDNTGAIQWQKTLGGTGSDEIDAVQQTADGGYILAGSTTSADGDVTSNHGQGDYWVVKLSNTGTIQWQKTYGGTGDDHANAIQQTTDGGYIVAGNVTSADGDVTGNHGANDYWVVKLDNAGVIQWQKTAGGTSDEYAYSVQQTSDGAYVITGYTGSADGDVTNYRGNNDIWLVKLTSAGVLQWQQTLGGSNYDYAYGVRQTTDGGFIVTGYTASADGEVTGYRGLGDGWVVKMSPDTAPLAAVNNIQTLASGGGLKVTWVTTDATNIAHFDIEISTDNKTFTKVGSVTPQIQTGGTPQNLSFSVQAGQLAAGALWFLALIPAFAKRRKMLMLSIFAAILATFSFISCKKSDRPVTKVSSYKYVRIAVVSKDGSTHYSASTDLTLK